MIRLCSLVVSIAILTAGPVTNTIADNNRNALEQEITASPRPVHSVLVASKGQLVFEVYKSGQDQPWGPPKGVYGSEAEALRDMRSITKSVVSLLIGMAIDRAEIDIDRPIFDYLPEYRALETGAARKISVRNLLSMNSGLVANEMVPYRDANNTERLMTVATDPVAYALSRNVIHEPGTSWAYDGGSTMILARILKNVTKLDLLDLARRDLFNPLGIADVEWIKLKTSHEFAAHGGLRLRPRDLVKIGELVLNEGRYKDRALVSPQWIRTSTRPIHDAWYSDRYGMHWWSGESILPSGKKVSWIEALGVGGQRLYVVPDLDMVVVITAGLYDRADQAAIVKRIFEKALVSNAAD